MIVVYTVYSYEDQEIKEVFATAKEASEWVSANRKGREGDCYIEQWPVDFTKMEEK